MNDARGRNDCRATLIRLKMNRRENWGKLRKNKHSIRNRQKNLPSRPCSNVRAAAVEKSNADCPKWWLNQISGVTAQWKNLTSNLLVNYWTIQKFSLGRVATSRSSVRWSRFALEFLLNIADREKNNSIIKCRRNEREFLKIRNGKHKKKRFLLFLSRFEVKTVFVQPTRCLLEFERISELILIRSLKRLFNRFSWKRNEVFLLFFFLRSSKRTENLFRERSNFYDENGFLRSILREENISAEFVAGKSFDLFRSTKEFDRRNRKLNCTVDERCCPFYCWFRWNRELWDNRLSLRSIDRWNVEKESIDIFRTVVDSFSFSSFGLDESQREWPMNLAPLSYQKKREIENSFHFFVLWQMLLKMSMIFTFLFLVLIIRNLFLIDRETNQKEITRLKYVSIWKSISTRSRQIRQSTFQHRLLLSFSSHLFFLLTFSFS